MYRNENRKINDLAIFFIYFKNNNKEYSRSLSLYIYI